MLQRMTPNNPCISRDVLAQASGFSANRKSIGHNTLFSSTLYDDL